MDRQYIDDRHVVARHLAGQLAEDERAAFEGYCREHPEMIRELELAARMKGGLAALRDAGELESALRPSRRSSFRLAAAVAFAALGALLVVAAINVLRVPTMGVTAAAVSGHFRAVLPTTKVYSVERMRGDVYDAQIELPARAEAIELRILPGADMAKGPYKVVLKARKGAEIVEVASLGATRSVDGFIRVFITSAALKPGVYELDVVPAGTSDETGASEFRFVVGEVSSRS